MIFGALGLLCKLGRRPNLAAQVFFVSSLTRPHDANQTARGIFVTFSFTPIFNQFHLPKPAVSYGLVACSDGHRVAKGNKHVRTKAV